MPLTGTQEAHELLQEAHFLVEMGVDPGVQRLVGRGRGESTRGQSATRYVEVEPWAWARLSQRLRAIRARRSKLRPAVEAA